MKKEPCQIKREINAYTLKQNEEGEEGDFASEEGNQATKKMITTYTVKENEKGEGDFNLRMKKELQKKKNMHSKGKRR